ncbi:MAG: dinuclear metal center YbgI/SA1388 family protein [Pirellulaceae bacterium]|jgi:dinuclear metal center YbgI/SA1388 family protein
MIIQNVCGFLNHFAPRRLAEDWDNVGLLVGDRQADVQSIMTCLTITPASVAEAITEQADLIVAHHPLPFRPLKRLTADTTAGKMLLDLIGAGIAVYSPHTSFDSAAAGINQRLAEGLSLQQIQPLKEIEGDPDALGSGRFGVYSEPIPFSELVALVKKFLRIDGLHVVGDDDQKIRKVAVACGAAGQLIDQARRVGCHVLVTGETNFHTCLEAEATGTGLVLPGHFASERFALEYLAEVLSAEFSDLKIWASRVEADPLRWL